MIAELDRYKVLNNKQETNTEPSNNKSGGGGLKCILLVPKKNFPIDSVVVEMQKLFSLHGGFLTIATYHHSQTI